MDGDELPADDVRRCRRGAAGLHAMIVDGKKGEAGDCGERAQPGAIADAAGLEAGRNAGPFASAPAAKWPETPDDRWILSPTDFAIPDVGDPAGADSSSCAHLPRSTPRWSPSSKRT